MGEGSPKFEKIQIDNFIVEIMGDFFKLFGTFNLAALLRIYEGFRLEHYTV